MYGKPSISKNVFFGTKKDVFGEHLKILFEIIFIARLLVLYINFKADLISKPVAPSKYPIYDLPTVSAVFSTFSILVILLKDVLIRYLKILVSNALRDIIEIFHVQ